MCFCVCLQTHLGCVCVSVRVYAGVRVCVRISNIHTEAVEGMEHVYMYMFIYVYLYMHTFFYIYTYIHPIPRPLPVHFFGSRPQPPTSASIYAVAMVSRIDKITGLLYRISSFVQGSLAKETYDSIDPTKRSHPISVDVVSVVDLSRQRIQNKGIKKTTNLYQRFSWQKYSKIICTTD